MEEKGFVNIKFIIFLKATLGRMVATKILPQDFLNLQFWQLWPKKFFNVRSYESTKKDLGKQTKVAILMGDEEGDENNMDCDRDLGQPAEDDLQTQLQDSAETNNSASILSNTVKYLSHNITNFW